jgi:hypothetical protein
MRKAAWRRPVRPVRSRRILRRKLALRDGVVAVVGQVGVLVAAGEDVVMGVIVPVALEVGQDGTGAEPLADEVVDAGAGEHGAVAAVVHHDAEAELAPAEQDDGEEEGEGVGPEGGQGKDDGDEGPVEGDGPGGEEVAAAGEAGDFVFGEEVAGTGAAAAGAGEGVGCGGFAAGFGEHVGRGRRGSEGDIGFVGEGRRIGFGVGGARDEGFGVVVVVLEDHGSLRGEGRSGIIAQGRRGGKRRLGLGGGGGLVRNCAHEPV